MIHLHLISPLALAPLSASQPLTASPQDDEPWGCFSPSSVLWQGGILGKSHPSSAVAAHLPPTLQPGDACLPPCLSAACLLPAPSLGCFDPCPAGSPPGVAWTSHPWLLDIPERLLTPRQKARTAGYRSIPFMGCHPCPEWALPPDLADHPGHTHTLGMARTKL